MQILQKQGVGNLSTNMLKRKSQNGKSYGIEIDGWEIWIPSSQISINDETGLFRIEFESNHSFKLQKYTPNRNKILNADEFSDFLMSGAQNVTN